MKYKFLQIAIFAVLGGLFAPGLALAHPGIGVSQWPWHVAVSPFAAWDHILATVAVLTGLAILVQKQASKIRRTAGAAILLAGLFLFLV